ncbi:MAG: Succinyl-CoA--L-malate CoA-transferase beta subunit [Alphaproteobacteria bacterium MarineAlpha4_Bin2]|nr:MAG: Succinyl-CoA--L-malate CoA-transferase beta subunit [Alphaproteobacteria bacterium MarineAlpha4_Bin2]
MSEGTAAPLPLDEVRVIEFCQTIMGPSCGLVLADLGADLIKVEPAPGGDKTRRLSGFGAGFYTAFNRNKRGVAIDVKSKEGREVAQKLIEDADVVIENYAPGTMDRLGIGYEEMSKRNPKLIFCSLKGFLSGPYENRLALDEVVQFMGGLAYMTGPQGQPLRAGSSVIDIMGGTYGVIGILCALRDRQHTGKGQLVKGALYESVTLLMMQHMAGGAMLQKPVPPMTARQRAWCIYECFETKDGDQIFIGITSDNHWERFCQRFGHEGLLEDPALKTNEDRVANPDRVRPPVKDACKAHTKAEMCAIAEEIGIPFAPVSTTEDLYDDPQLNAGGRMCETILPDGRTVKLPRIPVEVGDHQFALRRQPPEIGEHTREVLGELGYSLDDIATLEASGAVKSS